MKINKRSISVLLPSYNNDCSSLVATVQRQAEKLRLKAEAEGAEFDYEIIVYDDGSTSRRTVEANRTACERTDRCRMVCGARNAGRSAARNRLVAEARMEHVLFIDSDLSIISDSYIESYAEAPDTDAVTGGLEVIGDAAAMRSNLRCAYEKNATYNSSARKRDAMPYSRFHVSNLLIRRDTMLKHPFDESIHRYGYEDVLLGKELQRDAVSISHIDNPVGFCHFESNASFLRKTEEGLQTLHSMRDRLRGYSGIQTVCERLQRAHLLPLVALAWRMAAPMLRHNLKGGAPSLTVYTLYRIGYYATLKD